MPKESLAGFYARVAAEYPGVFRNDNTVLFCLYCNQQVAASKLFQVKQHLSTAKHQSAENRAIKKICRFSCFSAILNYFHDSNIK